MKHKHIETMREIRLWIGQIIVPTVTLLGSTMVIPEVRQAVAVKANEWKESIQERMKQKQKNRMKGA